VLRVFADFRKPGKLPFERHSFKYDLEYGTDTLEMHVDGVKPGQKVLVVDDLLATGGTVKACCNLLDRLGAKIEACAFVIELEALKGRTAITPNEAFSLLKY
jgi:adenine phosphoribosyltransferase